LTNGKNAFSYNGVVANAIDRRKRTGKYEPETVILWPGKSN